MSSLSSDSTDQSLNEATLAAVERARRRARTATEPMIPDIIDDEVICPRCGEPGIFYAHDAVCTGDLEFRDERIVAVRVEVDHMKCCAPRIVCMECGLSAPAPCIEVEL